MKKDLEDIAEKCREECQEIFTMTIPKFSDSYSRNIESEVSIQQPKVETKIVSKIGWERRWYTFFAWEHEVIKYETKYQISYTKIAESTHFSYIKQFGDFVNDTNNNIQTSTINVVESQINHATAYINRIGNTLSTALEVKDLTASDQQELINVLSNKVEVYKNLRRALIERD